MRSALLLAPVLLAFAPFAHADSFRYDISANTANGPLQIQLTSPSIVTSKTEFNGSPSQGYDLVRIIPEPGSLGGCLDIPQAACVQIYTLSSGQPIELDFATSLTGVYNQYSSLPATGPYGARGSLLISPLTSSTAPTPEPSSLVFLGTGALALLGAVRRRLA